MVDVLGIGVLMVGKSGIGKERDGARSSSCAATGHGRLILLRRSGRQLSGRGAGILGHNMEIRGLGIINVKDLFGIAAVRESKVVDLVAELQEWDGDAEYDRLGFDDQIEIVPGRAAAQDPAAGAPWPQPRDPDRGRGPATSCSRPKASTRRGQL